MRHVLQIATAAILLVGAAITGVGQVKAAEPEGPSFACSAARTMVEKTICADPALAAEDREMAKLFGLARKSASGHGPSNELVAQRAALKDMRSCESAKGNAAIAKCLSATYARRNFELATALLMRTPEIALPVLRRIDPGFAPVLEAVALWADAPVDARWSSTELAISRRRIATLLSPYLIALKTNEDQSFGWSILSQPGGASPTVTSIDDLFRSDRHFAAFLNVLGPYLPNEGSAGVGLRDLPCAAILRHPDLLDATDAVFGSTMDNFGFRTDCDRTLPPTPALTALDSKIIDSWPQCDGTIRFAAYRSYNHAVDAARIGRVETPSDSNPDVPRSLPAAEIAKVRSELERYYADYLAKSPDEAAMTARTALNVMLSAAHSCGT